MTIVEIILGVLVLAVFAWRKCAEAERDLMRQMEAYRLAERMTDREPRLTLVYKAPPEQRTGEGEQ